MMAAVKARPPRRAAAYLHAGAHRHRLHQLADAVHDERGLRAVPAAARRSLTGQGDIGLLAASTRISLRTTSTGEPGGSPEPEHRAGKADRSLGRAAAGQRARRLARRGADTTRPLARSVGGGRPGGRPGARLAREP